MRAAAATAELFGHINFDATHDPSCLPAGRAILGLLDRCPLGVDELPAPLLPNEHSGPTTLLINCPLLVLPFGGGAIGHDGGIPVAADFKVIYKQRLEFDTAALAVLQILRAVLDDAARAVMRIVSVQDALQESDIDLEKGRMEVLDELRRLAFIAANRSKGPAARPRSRGP